MKTRFLKGLCTFLLCAAVSVLAPLQAEAADVPKLDKKGTITIDFIYDGKRVEDGAVTLFKVADVDNTDENYTYVKTAEFQDYDGDIENWDDPEEIKKMEEYIMTHRIRNAKTAQNSREGVLIEDVEVGLYFVVQTELSDGYKQAASFFVSMPLKVNGIYVYDVDATPKTEIEKIEVPTPSTEPTEEESTTEESPETSQMIPQTGVAEWRIPVFAAAGILIFAMGWYLFRKEAKND